SEQKNVSSDKILKELDEYKTEIDIFTSAFVSVFKGKEKIDFSEVRGLDFQRQPISWLDDATKDEMLSISKKNWAPQGKAGEGVVSEFSDTLQYGKDIDFYVLKKDNKVVAFIRFDKPTEDGHRYAGSFNVDPDYRGSAIGEAVIKNALDKEADKYILDATVYPQIQVGTKYVEESGFSITNVLPNYDNSGETFFEITCNKKNNELYASREATKEQLIAQHHDNNWQEKIRNNIIVLRFDSEKENSLVIKASEDLISAGYIGNRYFSDPKDKTKRFYVFEIKKDHEQNQAKAV
ncbi:GNAT family N-acetyltransferase, partial [Patescibacteria group bacterium]|nr:GNAT family N-acetyltransferase [Patescibacteria group bacterium]